MAVGPADGSLSQPTHSNGARFARGAGYAGTPNPGNPVGPAGGGDPEANHKVTPNGAAPKQPAANAAVTAYSGGGQSAANAGTPTGDVREIPAGTHYDHFQELPLDRPVRPAGSAGMRRGR